MYLNSNPLLNNNNNNNLLPPSQPFIRSQSDAVNNNDNSLNLDMAKQQQQQQENYDNNSGLRMKRYNSLPDVAEYLDPNQQPTNNMMNNNNSNNNNSQQINSLMAAFNHNNKLYEKNSTYFNTQHLTNNQIQNLHLPQIITTNSNNHSSNLNVNHYDHSLSLPMSAGLPVPLSAGLSMPLSAGLSVPLSAGMSVSSHESVNNLSHPSSVPHSPIFNIEQYSNNNNQSNNHLLLNDKLQSRRLPNEDNHSHLINEMAYSQGYTVNYSHNNPTNSNSNISPMSPHFPANPSNYQPYYQDNLMLNSQMKRAKIEDNFNNTLFQHAHVNSYLNHQHPHAHHGSNNTHMYSINESGMPMAIPIQNAPAPDAATAQAAQEAINASAHLPPPTDDSDPEAVPRRQHLRYPGDLYTPQWVRFGGHKKEGYCDLCSPGKWLQLKNSAYWYHKQFYHGISSVSGKFFSGPIQTRQKDAEVVEGLCHQCQQWIQMSSAKRRNSVLWFRHAHKCHVYHKPKSIFGKRV